MSDISISSFETRNMTTDDDRTLAVSGPLPQLGTLDERRAHEANEDPRFSGMWFARATFAPGDVIEWQWILMSKSRKEMLGEDLFQINNIPGFSEERWRNERGRQERLSLTKQYSFDLNFNLPQKGNILFVVGSIPELGLWNPKKGLQVTQSLNGDDMWTAKFECSNKITVFHWKLIQVNSETSEVQWEGHIYRAVTIEAIGGAAAFICTAAHNFIAQKGKIYVKVLILKCMYVTQIVIVCRVR